jgi:[acyl-carrier-protein] S-malonyltransferase
MGALVAEHAPDLLDRALALCGDDLFDRVDESTRYAQPAIFCASVAGWNRAAPLSEPPVAVAGHSLGEFAALVAAEAVDADAALELVALRGNLMADASEGAGGGSMLALLKASVEDAARLAAAHGVVVANDNAPGQLVLSGARDALAAVAEDARAEGLRAMSIGVEGAFHSSAMEPAVRPFADALAETRFRAPAFPVVSCLTGAPLTDPARELADALTNPVRWTTAMRALADLGARRFLDAGPGHVVAKLVRRNIRDAEAGTLADALEPANA